MKANTRFSNDVLAGLRKTKDLRIRAGVGAHRFIGIWFVIVNERVFVRSWSVKPDGWYQTFRKDYRGAEVVLNHWQKLDQFADPDRLMKFDFARGCHDNALTRAPRGGDEGGLAHQAQRVASKQRAVVVGLFGKDHFHEPGLLLVKRNHLHFLAPAACQSCSYFAISAKTKPTNG